MIINEAQMLEEIRLLLNLPIERFVAEMEWPNSKFYNYIKNGRKVHGTLKRRKSHPSIQKVFTGINKAMQAYPHWDQHKEAITAIVIKYLLPQAK